MSLKITTETPIFSKSRIRTYKKKKESVSTKKSPEMEYHISTFFHYDKRHKKQFCVISIETGKLFSSLNYEISVDVLQGKGIIEIKLLGLTARQTYPVQPLPARSELLFENIFGEQTISIIKQNGSINTFVVDYNIFKKEIKFVREFMPAKKNNKKFSDFTINTEKNTFGGNL